MLFAPAIEDSANLVVPVIVLCDVFKKVIRERGEDDALQIASVMQTGTFVDLEIELAMSATRFPLPLADSLIYATAQQFQATLWTQDEHFEHLPGVRFFPK